jgi:hypothetical protein
MRTLSVCAHTVSFKHVEVDTNSLWIISKKIPLDATPWALPYGGLFCTLYLSDQLINKTIIG